MLSRTVSSIGLSLLFLAGPLWANRKLTITEVFLDNPETPTSITIIGERFSFGREPVVTLGEVGALPVHGVPTDTRIVALLPANLAAGDYRLSVSTGTGDAKNDEYDLTIGAAGPTGPMGPTGPAGPAGPPDPAVAAMVVELQNEVCRLFQQTGEHPRPAFCPPPTGTCPCAAAYELVGFSTTPTCLDQPELDNQLLLEVPGARELILSRFEEGEVTNACSAQEVDNDFFFFRDLTNNEDAEACRDLIFARAASLGVVCE